MFQHPIITAALAEQRHAELMAAAQHARDLRVATGHVHRTSRHTFRPAPRSVAPVTTTPVRAATRWAH